MTLMPNFEVALLPLVIVYEGQHKKASTDNEVLGVGLLR